MSLFAAIKNTAEKELQQLIDNGNQSRQQAMIAMVRAIEKTQAQESKFIVVACWP